MEFKLNKIDMDVRQRINQETSMDKIHTKKEIEVNKDKSPTKEEIDENKKKFNKAKENETDSKSEKKEKHKTDEDDENIGQDPYRGHFIDIKK